MKENNAQLTISIFVVWLFTLTAILGISIGHKNWFEVKTPVNLLVDLALLVAVFPIAKKRYWWAMAIFFCTGMLVEWVGVHYGWLFGDYSYGANFGIKFEDVPILIGVNWAILTFITGEISNTFKIHWILKALIGSSLMVFLDFFLEHSAPIFDYWTFEGGTAPFQNYIAWFGIAFLFHVLFQQLKIRGNRLFSIHLYLAQLTYFIYFFFWFR